MRGAAIVDRTPCHTCRLLAARTMTIARPKLHATLASRFVLSLVWACCLAALALAAGCGLGGTDPALGPPDASPGDGSTAPDTSGDSAMASPDSATTAPDSGMASPDSAT